MLSVEESKKYLSGLELTDEQVLELRGALYALIESDLDSLLGMVK